MHYCTIWIKINEIKNQITYVKYLKIRNEFLIQNIIIIIIEGVCEYINK